MLIEKKLNKSYINKIYSKRRELKVKRKKGKEKNSKMIEINSTIVLTHSLNVNSLNDIIKR